jgi:hypothetical protein
MLFSEHIAAYTASAWVTVRTNDALEKAAEVAFMPLLLHTNKQASKNCPTRKSDRCAGHRIVVEIAKVDVYDQF